VLGDIAEDLLASATMTAGAAPRDRVDLAAVASAARDSVAPPYAESLGVAVCFECDKAADGPFEVVESQAALRRALTSLVDNALAHEHDGGTIDLRVGRDGEKVSVTVTDDGVGIDPQTLPTLFRRFSHGEHTRRAGREAHGIGLAWSARLHRRDYLSSGLRARNVTPAATPAITCAAGYTHNVGQANMCITAAPRVTAGLNAPPEMPPTATAPAATVKPIANP
jgi:light-regulated signal transduction histidine kinase (bacteriophytochrome)